MQFGKKIKQLRKQEKLTLRQLSDKIGVSYPYLSDIERGKTKTPSTETMEKFVDFFNLPISYFYEEEGNPVPLDHYMEYMQEDIKEFITEGIKNGKARPYLVLAKEFMESDLNPDEIKDLVNTMKKYINKDKK